MTRRTNDFYETAPWQVDALVDNLPELTGTIWCPCVGDGSLMDRLWQRLPGLSFITSDIDDKRWADFCGDATQAAHWQRMLNEQGAAPDWVVENPPFNAEIDILKLAYEHARCGVVFMARASFAEPTGDDKVAQKPRSKPLQRIKRPRGPWLSSHPYHKRISLERHSFTGDGNTDMASTDWFVWAKVPVAGPFGISAYGYRPSADERKAERAARGNPEGRAPRDPALPLEGRGLAGDDAGTGTESFTESEY